MSEFASEPVDVQDAPVGESAAPESDGGWSFSENVGRDEWESVSSGISFIAEQLREQQQQQFLEKQQADWDAYLGDPFLDPDGYEQRLIAADAVAQRDAALSQQLQEQQQRQEAAAFQAQVDGTLAAELARGGEGLDEGEVRALAAQTFEIAVDEEAVAGLVRQGIQVTEGTLAIARQSVMERVEREKADDVQKVIRAAVEALTYQQGLRGGDESSVVRRHFPRVSGSLPAAPLPRTAEQQQIINNTLGRWK